MITLWQLDECLEALAGDALCSLLMVVSFLQLPVWVKASPDKCLHLTEMSLFSLSESGQIFELVQCVGPAFKFAIYKVGF